MAKVKVTGVRRHKNNPNKWEIRYYFEGKRISEYVDAKTKTQAGEIRALRMAGVKEDANKIESVDVTLNNFFQKQMPAFFLISNNLE